MSAFEHWETFKEKELQITNEMIKKNLIEFVDEMLELFKEVFNKGYKAGYDEAKTESAEDKAGASL
jgi:flagellar biosynthesis/type III secretory pathway protein FliH